MVRKRFVLRDEIFGHTLFDRKRMCHKFLSLSEEPQFPDVAVDEVEKFPLDYFKRYSDPDVCYITAVLASRATTDLVIGRTTRVTELDMLSRR